MAQEMVRFPALHDGVELVGYLLLPAERAPLLPAVAMMHGRGGAYSTLAKGSYSAETLSKRHRAWGELWTQHGFVALLLDGFGSRGYPAGFGRFSYKDRPPELDETLARPQDAFAALLYLRQRGDIAAGRIGLMGWSNGGSASLVAMADNAPGRERLAPEGGFTVAAALYFGCGLKDKYRGGLNPAAPLHIYIGDADEETPAPVCETLVKRSRAKGYEIGLTVYPGAEHSFDSGTTARNAAPGNVAAAQDATVQILASFKAALLPGR